MSVEDDEHLARVLQAQYDMEIRDQLNSPPPHHFNTNISQPLEQAPRIDDRNGGDIRTRPDDDEDLAKIIFQQLNHDHVTTNLQSNTQNVPNGSYIMGDNTRSIVNLHEGSDLEIAMKLDQELRDEAFARSLAQDSNIQNQYVPGAIPLTPASRRSNLRRVVLPILVAVVLIVAVLLFVTKVGRPSSILPTPFIPDNDPFFQSNSSSTVSWKSQGNGLTLDVINALDPKWHKTFYTAIANWEDGNPDALSLNVINGSVIDACDAVNGKLKVCNANFGQTNWRGLNEIVFSSERIVSSVAKMNEFYLASADEATRLYTMCHEIGHGFGLQHTDENFTNEDLGNCMDYTVNPEKNNFPDDTNFATLVSMYGEVPKLRNLKKSNTSTKEEMHKGNDHVWSRIKAALYEIEKDNFLMNNRYPHALLRKSLHGEQILIKLPHDHHLLVTKLFSVETPNQ